jgi:glutathione S-transferase
MSSPMPTFELHWFPGTCSRVVLVALEELGVPYETHMVNMLAGEQLGPEYLALNPKGKVPTLVVDGRPMTENPAIHTYLARRYPDAGLLPDGDEELEIDALTTMSWFAAGVHPLVSRHRFPQLVCESPEGIESIRQLARAQLERCFAILEERVAGRDWLFGDWSIVDPYMLWLWFRATGSGMDGTQFPLCSEHALRTEARPSVARVLDREEEAFARLKESEPAAEKMPPYQVGRAPQPTGGGR